MMTGICQLPIVNYSRKNVRFTIEFYDSKEYNDHVLFNSLMNYYHPPYEVTLKEKEKKNITIRTNINVSHIRVMQRAANRMVSLLS
ncbi:hypothetical protein [Heyndrickxia acidicola]|uniref:LAGLIDADG homing endonuclease n=1 Tax=Heyndrickxia acidicola TaxID=209389 RepID=A0ABU6MIK6_9BACI|nr:hypothetical protein [Heyndrickxia acidicola]MED1203072.1 hypothetical protein [Heyndrickxia acidicola]